VKGVVTGDGRLTCPWHGACFHIDTGDIESMFIPLLFIPLLLENNCLTVITRCTCIGSSKLVPRSGQEWWGFHHRQRGEDQIWPPTP